MAPHFVRDAEIAAGLAPLGAMGRNPAAPRAEPRQQVRQLMSQRAINFRLAMIDQARIQRNKRESEIGAPGRAKQTRIPFHAQ
jgi:hypothetical protein